MNPIVKLFFERDLNPQEEDELAKTIEESPEEAVQFLEMMEKEYLRSGLPLPSLELKKGFRFPFRALVPFAAGILICALSLWVYQGHENPGIQLGVVSLRLAPSAKELGYASARKSIGGTVQSISLYCPRDIDLRIQVTDGKDKVLKELYEGKLPKGFFSCVWDEKKQTGEDVGPGIYEIVVKDSAGSKLLSAIEIKIDR